MKQRLFFLIIMLFTASMVSAINYTIELSDPGFGDGWNGGSMDVLVNGVIVLDDITLSAGSGPEIFVFSVNNDDIITTDYTAGGWSYENFYQVIDETATAVAESGHPNGTPGNITYVVPPAPPAVPLSNWAFALIGLLALTFVFIKFRK